MSSAFQRIARDILFPDRDQHPIPVMDGHLSPNDGLARCSDLSTFEDAPDDVAFDRAGAWYVSVGCTVMRSRSTL